MAIMNEGEPGAVFIMIPKSGQLDRDSSLDDAMEEMI